MEHYNEELNRLAQQLRRHQHLLAATGKLKEQRSALAGEVEQLKEQAYREELDVERLEGFSLSRVLLRLTGRLDEALEKEEAEACAAALKYDAKRRQLQELEQELKETQAELASLADCQRQYDDLLAQKQQALKTMNSYYAQRICALETSIAQLKAEEQELREAVSAAGAALRAAERVSNSLSSAGNWSTVDILGGGLISDVAKHSHLDRAQTELHELQRALARLHRELADVDIHAGLQVQVDGFLRFADYFFDGLFADWAVRSRIAAGQQQVQQTISAIHAVQRQLEDKLSRCRRQWGSCQQELDKLVREA